MPASNDHGKTLNTMCDDLRDQTPITRICGHCAYTVEGLFGNTADPMREHLRVVHGIQPAPKRRERNRLFVSETKLDTNIAGARAAGSAVDYDQDAA